MAELLKNKYDKAYISNLSAKLRATYPSFDEQKFYEFIFDNHFENAWEDKELKQRISHISLALKQFLPAKYTLSLNILKKISPEFTGFEALFFPDFVAKYGLEDFQQSMQALEIFTQYSSAEFAVRPFIDVYGNIMMQQMKQWALSDNLHLRRLASEGCRPRLPWASSLSVFKKDPQAIFPILELLQHDPSDYVRRSVANNLNDIGKDHPEKLIKYAKKWHGTSTYSSWIIKHACRNLLKQGQAEIMALFEYPAPDHILIQDFCCDKQVETNQQLNFSFTLLTPNTHLGKLRIEFAIDFMKKNGKNSRKIFKISEADYKIKQKVIHKSFSFQQRTTRKYYPGEHGLTILINAQAKYSVKFLLK